MPQNCRMGSHHAAFLRSLKFNFFKLFALQSEKVDFKIVYIILFSIVVIVPISAFIMLYYCPETPVWLLRKGKIYA